MLFSRLQHTHQTQSGPNRIRISHLNAKSITSEPTDKTTPDLFKHPEIELYFISLYTLSNTPCLFGKVNNHHVDLNPTGQAVQECWYDLPVIYPNIHLDLCVVMPNHLHGIIILHKLPKKNVFLDETALVGKPGITADIQEMMQKFIDISSKNISEFNASTPDPIWKNPADCERIKNETRLNLLRDYIADNPASWDNDPVNPNRTPCDIGRSSTKQPLFKKQR